MFKPTRHEGVNQTLRGSAQQRHGETHCGPLMLKIGLPDAAGVLDKPVLQHKNPPGCIAGQIINRNAVDIISIEIVKSQVPGKISTMALDRADIAILRLLQHDASPSISEIADSVHLSVNACWRRIKRLEETGVIRKRVALLDPHKLGVGVTVFVSLRAAEHSEKWLQNFAAAVRAIPEIVELYRMAGDVDYLLKLQVADIAAYDRVYKRLIRVAKLMDVSGAFAMEEMKRTTELPLPQG